MSILQSIPYPTKIREELERMVLKDLLGPVDDPEEYDELPQGGSGPVENGLVRRGSPNSAGSGTEDLPVQAQIRGQAFGRRRVQVRGACPSRDFPNDGGRPSIRGTAGSETQVDRRRAAVRPSTSRPQPRIPQQLESVSRK